MTKKSFNLRKMIVLAICLAGITNVVAQDYVGTYSGTITITLTVYKIGDPSNVNTKIFNQKLQVNSDWFGFVPNIPLFKDGETISVAISDVTFEPNGDFSAPENSYEESGMTFTDISGNVSGNTINLTLRTLDTETGGTLLDATCTYTGIKQEVGINEVLTTDNKIIVGYYSITGQKLNKEPESGLYIVVYDNGRGEKVMKK